MVNEKKLVVLSGPSGCGKDTVLKELKKIRKDITNSISFTTRSPREGEKDGVNYYFITKEDFRTRLEAGRVLEYNEYAGNIYGTPKDELEKMLSTGKTVIMVIDVHGGANVKKAYPGCMLAFLLPPSLEELERRIRDRGLNSEEDIRKRLRIAQDEISCAENYDMQFINADLNDCVKQISTAIDKWQSKKGI